MKTQNDLAEKSNFFGISMKYAIFGIFLTQAVVFSKNASAQNAPNVSLGSSMSLLGPGVNLSDFTLDPVPPQKPINAAAWGYAHQWGLGPIMENVQYLERPMYEPFNRNDPKWWDEQLDEVLFSRVPLLLVDSRGCYHPEEKEDSSGAGNMCPHSLSMLVDAVKRAGAESVLRVGMFIDTAAYAFNRQHLADPQNKITWPVYSNGQKHPPLFDLTDAEDQAGHRPIWYFWDADIKQWFEQIPRQLWYMYNDNGKMKPVIVFFGLSNTFSNQHSNASKLLEEISKNFENEFGAKPFFVVLSDWLSVDQTLAVKPNLVGGVHGWFVPTNGNPDGESSLSVWDKNKWTVLGKPNGAYTTIEWNNKRWGAMVASFFCGPTCMRGQQIARRDGETFIMGLKANQTSEMNIIEGLNDPVEGNGLMRSDDPTWNYTNHYLDIVRQYSDLSPTTIRFQAEAADEFINADQKPATVFRYGKALGIVPLGKPDAGVGWALGYTTPGEAILYRKVYLAAGNYKFTIRLSSDHASRYVHFSIDQFDLPKVNAPMTENLETYEVIELGSSFVEGGQHDLKVTLDTGGVNVDWFFSKWMSP